MLEPGWGTGFSLEFSPVLFYFGAVFLQVFDPLLPVMPTGETVSVPRGMASLSFKNH
jgi:hypothetical protein